MKADKIKIAKIIDDIQYYLGKYESLPKKGREVFWAKSMLLFSAINRSIDFGNYLVGVKKLGAPSSYKEIFSLLKEEGIISARVNNSFNKLVDFRNKISHRYHRISEKEVEEIGKKIGNLRDFISEMKSYLRRTS